MYLNETDKIVEIGFEVAEHSPAMLAYWDKNLVCRFANHAHLAWLGKDPQHIIDKTTLKQFLGPQFEKTLPYVTTVLKGIVQVFEREVTSPTGKIINALVTYSPNVENGEVTGFYVHASDITGLKNKIDSLAVNDNQHVEDAFLYSIDKSLRSSILTGFPGIVALAKQHFVSESKLKRAFKEAYGTSIFSYYRNLQMEYADKYISEHKSTRKQMAAMLHFINPSNFAVCYQKYLKEHAIKKLIEKIKKDSHQRYTTFVNRSPFAFAMFDKEMRFIAASQKWKEDYLLYDENFIGNVLYEIFPGTQDQWKPIHAQCLANNVNKSGETLFYKADGSAAWLKWDIRPWHSDTGEVGGLMIFTEDVTELKNQEDENKKVLEILNKTNEIAKIGAWKRNFITNTGIWSKILKEILEVDEHFEPNLETAINFYKEGYSRNLIKKAIDNAINKGIAFDVEAEMITAKGNEKKVRVIGYPDFKNGKCEKLMGIFQDITRVL